MTTPLQRGDFLIEITTRTHDAKLSKVSTDMALSLVHNLRTIVLYILILDELGRIHSHPWIGYNKANKSL